jgi:hypothetical protein
MCRVATSGPGHPWHDALGLFSVTVTDDWKVTGGTGGAGESYMFHEVNQQQDWGIDTLFADAYVSIEVSYANVPADPCPPGPGYGAIPATVDGWTTYTD